MALEDADVALFLLSAALLSQDACFDRLRKAYQRHLDGQLHLLAVFASPFDLSGEDFPGLPFLLARKAISAYGQQEDAGWHG